MDIQLINVSKLHQELALAGLPVVGVASDGRVDYARPLSKVEQTKADEIIGQHDPRENPLPTTDQIVLALWKKVMLNDPNDADALQDKVKEFLP